MGGTRSPKTNFQLGHPLTYLPLCIRPLQVLELPIRDTEGIRIWEQVRLSVSLAALAGTLLFFIGIVMFSRVQDIAPPPDATLHECTTTR